MRSYQLIQLRSIRIMKSNTNKEKNCETPVKKWLHMSPFQEDLAIIESQSSQDNQMELFNELVGHTPSFNEEQSSVQSSVEDQQEEQNSSRESSSQEPQESPHTHTVNEMKLQQENTTEKVAMRVVDTNRKGCKCRNSKCEKNYCDCLKMGLVCGDGCSCEDCHNTEEKDIHRENNKKMVEIEANPTRKCTCRKSKCLKKYCQCHSSGRKCSSLCQCIECSNQDENEKPFFETLKKLRKTTNILGSGTKIIF